ncbi:uncharacterized protein NPIL_615861 [Nephila pilipes]|uniref:Uncharacterized protein n=1 Tax=Nephila pilipes TaxID=299642 RepID=A0A8X6N9Z0_NEPPI|nr:uncharacterized protein NPIL_615861 [Nephila pilipes]
MILQFQSDDKTIEVTEEEGRNLDFLVHFLDSNSGASQILRDFEHLHSFLEEKTKEDPQALLKGEKTIKMFGPCYVTIERDRIEIQTNLEKIFLGFLYSSPHKIFGNRFSAKASVMLFSANILTEFKINNETGKIDSIRSFNIKDFNDMQVQVKGIRPFNRVATAVINFANILLKKFAKRWLEAQIKKQINQLLLSLEMSSQTTDETYISSQEFNVNSGDFRVKDDEIRLNTEEALVSADKIRVNADKVNVNINGIRVDNEIRVKTSEAHVNKEIRVFTNKTRMNNKETRVRDDNSKINNKVTCVKIDEIRLKTETYAKEAAPPPKVNQNLDG